MLARLKSLLDGVAQAPSAERGADDLRLAAAVLMVEAATLDGELDSTEEASIKTILGRHFSLDESEIETLFDEARQAQDEAAGLVRYTRVIKDHFSEEERIRMMEMLWEVVYADGVLDDYEANLLRRIGGLLYVPDRETGAARLRVLTRLGIEN